MSRLNQKNSNYKLRAQRVRAYVRGSSERPRLSVHVSNHHLSAQIIDDSKQHTLAYATTVGQKYDGNMTKKAEAVGSAIAKQAKAVKVSKVVFDRGGKLYHGRIAALAEAARKAGLEF
ncbi:MAG TPA: 50S ribosomal protein L18 [Candidatus Dormibacteraeota bacterium]|nr:50S ribosomal protein L18 [Candidatus Dormibacteraeota bacterium]